MIPFLLSYIPPSTYHIKIFHTVLLRKEPKAEGRREGGGTGILITWLTLELVVYCFHRCCKSQGSHTQGQKRQLHPSHFLMIVAKAKKFAS